MLFSKIIKKKFDAVLGRYEENPAVYFFSPKDFPQLKEEKFNVTGDKNVTLKGAFYYYDNLRTDRLVIFDHGISSGYHAYFKEIEYLARNGYTVYSYDHTGCASSEGSGILGFAQGVNDLDKVLSSLKEDERFKSAKFVLIGHSWGGYSAMNAAQFHKEVTHVVSLAGFLSARALVNQYLPKFVLKYSDEVMDRERLHNPKYADLDARESLKNTDAKFIHFQSKDDTMVKYDLCYTPLYEALKERKGTEFVSVDNKHHSPQKTEEACRLEDEMTDKLNKLMKKKELSSREAQDRFRASYNWDAVNEQDEKTWNKILDFIKE